MWHIFVYTNHSNTLHLPMQNLSVPGLSDWIEQLIAESTGKDSTGRLPIATEDVCTMPL
jgi:glucose-6-phosphate isomerase